MNTEGISIDVHNVYGHYEIYVAGRFYCSCESMAEVGEELEELNCRQAA